MASDEPFQEEKDEEKEGGAREDEGDEEEVVAGSGSVSGPEVDGWGGFWFGCGAVFCGFRFWRLHHQGLVLARLDDGFLDAWDAEKVKEFVDLLVVFSPPSFIGKLRGRIGVVGAEAWLAIGLSLMVAIVFGFAVLMVMVLHALGQWRVGYIRVIGGPFVGPSRGRGTR